MGVFKLAWREFLLYWKLSLLACICIGAAGALMIFNLGTDDSAKIQGRYFARQIAGKYDLWISQAPRRFGLGPKGRGMVEREHAAGPEEKVVQPVKSRRGSKPSAMPEQDNSKRKKAHPSKVRRGRGKSSGRIDQNLLDALKADKRVKQISPARQTTVTVTHQKLARHHAARGSMCTTNESTPPFDVKYLHGKWIDPSSTALQAVISSNIRVGKLFSQQSVQPGDVVRMSGPGAEYSVTITGIIELPQRVSQFPSIFVSGHTFDTIASAQGQPKYNYTFIELKDNANASAFYSEWKEKINPRENGLSLYFPDDLPAPMARRGGGSKKYQALGLTFLCSIMLVYMALSTGLARKKNLVAKLRACGMTRFQSLRLIGYYGLFTCLAGAILAVALGCVVLLVYTKVRYNIYPEGMTVSTLTIVGSVCCILLGGLIGFIPSLWSTFTLPVLANLHGKANAPRRSIGTWRLVCSILLLVPLPFICLYPPMSAAIRGKLFYAVGVPTMLLGFFLFAPILVIILEKIFSPLLAFLLGLNPALLRQQLSSKLRQSAAIVICLSLGLGLFFTIRIWGNSMTEPFEPQPGMPDAIVSFKPTGVPAAYLSKVESLEVFVPNRCLPIYSRQVLLDKKTQQKLEDDNRRILQQNTVLVTGMNMQKAFAENEPLLGLNLIEGNRREVVEKLSKGNYCVIPESFRNHLRGGIGTKIGVIDKDGMPVILEVAGVIEMNWHIMTAWTGMRGLDGNPFPTLSLVLTSTKTAAKFADMQRVRFFWAKIKSEQLAKGYRQWGAELTATLRKVAAEIPEDSYLDPRTKKKVLVKQQVVRVFQGNGLIDDVRKHSDDILLRYSEFPAWSLAITMIALASMIASTVSTLEQEFAVLHTVGMTGSQVLRILFAESLLTGLCAIIFSLAGGLLLSWGVVELEGYTFVFTALPLELSIPWKYLAIGTGATLVLCLLAALWPAIAASCKEPLSLLKKRHN